MSPVPDILISTRVVVGLSVASGCVPLVAQTDKRDRSRNFLLFLAGGPHGHVRTMNEYDNTTIPFTKEGVRVPVHSTHSQPDSQTTKKMDGREMGHPHQIELRRSIRPFLFGCMSSTPTVVTGNFPSASHFSNNFVPSSYPIF